MKTQHFDRKTPLEKIAEWRAASLVAPVIVLLLASLWPQTAQASLPPAVFDFVVYATGTACGALKISGDATVDSFDSSQGSYSQTRQLSKGIVGVSGNITLSGNVTINGPVFATNATAGNCQNGTPGITTNGKASATGGYIQLGAAPSFPNPDPISAGSQDVNATANRTLAPGSYRNITVSGGATLTLSPGAYNINALSLSGHSSVTVNPAGQVVINLAGAGVSEALDLTAGSIVNTSGIPLNLQFIYGGNLPISLSGGDSAYAVLYAPNAPATLHGGSEWFGSMVVQTLDDSGNTSIHYDRSLAVPPSIVLSVSPSPNTAGWNNSDPTVTFTCSDPILGIGSCTPPVLVTTEGANQNVTGTAVNRAGFSATVSASINLDKTPPIVGGTSAPPTNIASWNSSPVTASFTCSDSLSGIASCTAPVVITTDGGGQIVTGTAVDKAGNTAAISLTINLDKTPPINTATVAPPPNAARWNNANATVNFSCSDPTSGIVSCPAPVPLNTEGSNQIVTGTATDRAGNSTTTSVTVNIDKTPPTISGTASPLPNAAGWNNSNVTATFTCSDALSGIASCTAPGTFSVEGANQTVNGTAVDKAGNTASATVPASIDKTAPTITGLISPAPNAAGWNNSDATVMFNCSDALSGVGFCTAPVTLNNDGNSQVVTGTALDRAGNAGTASVTVKLDKTPPGITISSPPTGSTISLSTASITVAGTANDTASGLAGVTCNDAPATLSGPNFKCTVSMVPGANTIAIKATDVAGNSNLSNLNLTYAPAPLITFTAPANLSVTNLTPVTVNGTINDANASLKINGIPAPQSSGIFSIPVPLVEGLNVLSAIATSANGVTGTATAQVTLDTTPPHITIDSPADGATTTDASVTVTGIANDVVVGTVNAQDAQVTVNGISAQVANRTYAAANVPLSLGKNTLQASGRDRAGNGTTTSITVTRVLPSQPPAPSIGNAVITYSLTVVSGNNQTGTIGTPLSAPLVVALNDSSNKPVANQTVVFKVTNGNGSLSSAGTLGNALAVTTNTAGQAQVSWTLGQRAGAGINSVEVSSALAFGTANFTATASTSNATRIVVDSGNSQTGVLGQPLSFPFVVIVVDSGFNRVPGVPVTFSVKQGGGNIDGAASKSVATDSNGRAIGVLTIGLQQGVQNTVEATFPRNPGRPVVFTAVPKAPGNPANTTVSGVVLDNSNNPISGVTLRLFQTNQGNFNNLPVQIGTPVQSNAQGTFTIPSAPVGFFKLMADGTTASGPKTYPTLEYDIVTVAGVDNTVGTPIYLPALDTVNKLCVDETHGGTLTLPQYPGFALTVLPGSATFAGGSHQGCVSVTPVNGDKVPMSPGFGQQPRFIVTIQPVGTTFNPPAPITLPNVDVLKPKAITEMYSYDHDLSMFVAIGTGTVSNDGSKIVSNPGVGVLKAGWHCGGDPNSSGSSGSLAVSISPTTATGMVNDTFDFTANGSPPLDGVYRWELINTQTGDDSSAATLTSSPSCSDQSSCTATVKGVHGGKLTLRVHFTCTTTGADVTADARITVNVKPILMKLTYSGTGFHTVAKDADGSNYGTPQWLDANLNGTATDPGENRFPVSYTRNSTVTVGAVFKLSGTVSNANAKVTGDGTGGLHFEGTVSGISGDTFTLPDTVATGNLPNSIKKLNPFQILWKVSFDDTNGYPAASFQTAGTSDNVMHVTLNDPGTLASPLYETILDIGTRNADGQTDAAATVSKIWANFAALSVARADGVVMGYWTGGVATCQSLALMLASVGGDGSCIAWSQLFHQTLEAEGITGSQIFQIRANTTVNAGADGFQVKKWNFGKHVRTGPNGLNDSDTAGDDFTVVPKGKGFPNQDCVGPGPDGTLETTPGPGNVVGGTTITTGANGICQTRAANDVQVISVGKGAANQLCVGPGANGALNTAPGPGNVVVGTTITTGANGICTSAAAGDDVQVLAVGKGAPNQVCIGPGPDGILDTMPATGNVVAGTTITTGPNGICLTTAADDVQVIAVGKGAPNLPAITPGANGTLNSAALPDDTTQDGLFVGATYPYLIFTYTDVFGTSGEAFGDSAEQPGISGQKNPNPPPIFFNHFIVEYGGMVWDPSYGAGPFGGPNNGENAHENAAIDGIKAGTRARKHDTAVKELRYDRAASLE